MNVPWPKDGEADSSICVAKNDNGTNTLDHECWRDLAKVVRMLNTFNPGQN